MGCRKDLLDADGGQLPNVEQVALPTRSFRSRAQRFSWLEDLGSPFKDVRRDVVDSKEAPSALRETRQVQAVVNTGEDPLVLWSPSRAHDSFGEGIRAVRQP